MKRGFTLVELLIVIALIAILSVAVLATINPIEQSNKARDAASQNDAAEMMNAYERMYANSQTYPWTVLLDAVGVEKPISLNSQMAGFGICGLGVGTSGSSFTPGVCTVDGSLVVSDELKTSFKGKRYFTANLASKPEDGLYMTKGNTVSSAIYVCYTPMAKSNRIQTSKLRCIAPSATGGVILAGVAGCAAPASTGGAEWGGTVGIGESVAHFICVPE
ncbi:MAG: type II secretion system protein [Candidatus Shapirobacteria bacterium]|nr:type II secretion system protein [Candidatus Shapirobacteria bacterium]